MNTKKLKTGLLLVAGAAVCSCAAASLDAYVPAPLVFDSPSENDRGSMILGNGELGAIAWVSGDGTLHTVLQRSDTWNEGARHVKAGAIDYVTGKPVDGGTFRQTMSLEKGVFDATWKSGGREVSLSYRIQHGQNDFAVCDVEGAPEAEAKVVNWRLYPGGAKEFGCSWKELGNQFDRILVNGKPLTFTVSADQLVPGGWCHVNRNETVVRMMEYYDLWQATGDLGRNEALSNRVFGGLTRTHRRESETGRPSRTLFLSAVTSLHPCRDAEEWRRRTDALLSSNGWDIDGEKAKRAAHDAAWRAFWNRSHIMVTPSQAGRDEIARFAYPYNPKLPVSFGCDSKGGTMFKGRLAVDPASRIDANGLLFAAEFNAEEVRGNYRLADNITPGGSDGSLVDILGGRIRLLAGQKTIFHPQTIKPREDVAVRVSVSPSGEVEMTVNGKVFRDTLSDALSAPATCAAVTRAWAVQRYTTACAGTGALPIRFNGSIFTTSESNDPDYRRWGSGYWWQNTRLPYYPVFAAGDLDVLEPMFRMYARLADFCARRTKKYLGHGGAFLPECIMPWGDHFPFVYGAKHPWERRPEKLQDGGWHKYEWVGQLEVSLMLLDYHAYTQDDAWFKKTALPAIREYVWFFDEHYKLDASGRYRMNPSQALETWWDCTNPMPEVAGLTCVTDRLLALPAGVLPDDDRARFAQIRARIPDLPTRTLRDGRTAYAPAERFAEKRNEEHPELYCVFPFRLCSFEKPNAELGRAAYAARQDVKYRGWKQEELFAAYLGMADEAAGHLAARVLHNSATGFRWPAYWGPNFDWRPDQCAGGNIQNILQSLVMQCEGRKIFLLPAWPKGWDCAFKLHAPYRTTVEGRVENGKLKGLVVTPASRRADVILACDFRK